MRVECLSLSHFRISYLFIQLFNAWKRKLWINEKQCISLFWNSQTCLTDGPNPPSKTFNPRPGFPSSSSAFPVCLCVRKLFYPGVQEKMSKAPNNKPTSPSAVSIGYIILQLESAHRELPFCLYVEKLARFTQRAGGGGWILLIGAWVLFLHREF